MWFVWNAGLWSYIKIRVGSAGATNPRDFFVEHVLGHGQTKPKDFILEVGKTMMNVWMNIWTNIGTVVALRYHTLPFVVPVYRRLDCDKSHLTVSVACGATVESPAYSPCFTGFPEASIFLAIQFLTQRFSAVIEFLQLFVEGRSPYRYFLSWTDRELKFTVELSLQ